MATVLEQIKAQIDAGRDELPAVPAGVDWHARCHRTAEELVPWLQGVAAGLIEYMEGVLDAPKSIRRMWAEIRPFVALPAGQLDEFEKVLALDEMLSRSLNGQVISSILTKRLVDTAPPQLALTGNAGNDFPDLYLGCGGEWGYAALPKRKDTGKEGGAKEYGPSLVGAAGRPVRVPDGMEVKTSPRTVKADCHYNHAGLHLVIVYVVAGGVYRVADLKAGFLRPSDYKMRGRNTEATTVKYSFAGEPFISLLARPIVLPEAARPRKLGGGKQTRTRRKKAAE